MSNTHLTKAALPAAAVDKVSIAAPDDTPWAVMPSGVRASLSRINYNYFRNSGFWFAQRQAPATLTTYSAVPPVNQKAVTADGWGILNENASVQYVRGGTLGQSFAGVTPQAGYWGQWTKITNAGRFLVGQQLETLDATTLRGRIVRVQFWARGVATLGEGWRLLLIASNYSIANSAITANTGTLATGFGDPTWTVNLGGTSPQTALTPRTVENGQIIGDGVSMDPLDLSIWKRYSATFLVPTTTNALALMVVATGSVAIASGIQLTMASLTIGPEPQVWQPSSIETEFRRCQRFYAKSFPLNTAPAQNAGLSGAFRGYVSVGGATANQPLGIRHPVAMSDGPSGGANATTFFNPSNADAFVRNTTAGTNASATAINALNQNGIDVFFTGLAAWSAGQAVALHYIRDVDF